MRCDECGSAMRETRSPITEVIRGVEVTVDGIEHFVCDHCGNIVLDMDSAELLAREQLAEVAHAKGLLSPEEIRDARKSLGLTQKGFERLLGVASPTVSRWETGAMLPSQVACNLIRVLTRSSDAVEVLSVNCTGLRFEYKPARSAGARVVRFNPASARTSGKVGEAA